MSRATIILIAVVVVVIVAVVALGSIRTEVPVTHIEQPVANDASSR